MEAAEAKSIVLFSDGTGNSSAKLFKTNVWRMYEAVDLGPAPPGKRNQIAYYDDGVGTSGFRPLAIMGGVFGWGLKRNVLDIYQYACRNYAPGEGQQRGANPGRLGDHIYGFGFSRGAFTMRTAISLIASQGLVPYTDERDLERRSQDAYRAFCATGAPRYLKWLARGYRAVRATLSVGWRRLRGIPLYDPGENHRPVIRFIGVWDTVAAYGGPIAEITRAIDNWFFAMSMPNYRLNLEIERARHALALDDERDSFHPLLWDEVYEQALIDRREAGDETVPPWIDEDRLHQVWFTGVHADVGGGYPDESLSYVSLLWMMEEAGKADLRTLEVIGSRYRALANSYGPIHDSRSGLGSYYRYQPRKIDAWLDPVRPSTLGLRDPAINDEEGRPRGLVPEGRIRIHESVVARIQDGTDSYAPIVLPEIFQIVRPAARGENQPQADSDSGGPLCVMRSEYRVLPMVEPEVRARFTDPELAGRRSAAMERLWNLVMARRATYFLTVLATLAMASMPMWIDGVPEPLELTNNRTFGWEALFLNDGRNWIGSLVRLFGLFVPAFLESWIETYSTNPFYFLLVSATIVILLVSSKNLERRMRDRARAAWLPTTGRVRADDRPLRPSLLQKLRTATLYQRTIQVMKWHVLPNVIFMPVLLLIAAWIGLAVATQVTLPSLERSEILCGGGGSAGPQIQMKQSVLLVGRPCNPAGGMVQQGKVYYFGLEVREPWFDGALPATPLGLPAAAIPNAAGYLGVPLRRVIDARYLQPLMAVRSTSGGRQRLHIYPLELSATGGPDSEASIGEEVNFNGQFVAPATGELFLFVNDAMLPFGKRGPFGFDSTYFYRGAKVGNRGSACISIGAGDLDPNFQPDTVDPCASLPPAPQKAP
ncbi:MAG TPA: DUF2235 domain-containing protein [Allosphingosinicella sp.]|nr:DUF2235 domain-containing protein [Allosphingosinicella sp.]